MLRAIHEIKPKYIVGENVFGLLNWNGGMVFNEVQTDLESAGYEVQAVGLSAASVNAPHGRDRIFFVASNAKFKSEGSDGGIHIEKERNLWGENEGNVLGAFCSNGNVTDTDGIGLRGESNGIGESGFIDKKSKGNNWINFPTQSPICGRDDGLPTELDGITFPKWKRESLRAYGNAIVPQVAHQIFKAIAEIDEKMD